MRMFDSRRIRECPNRFYFLVMTNHGFKGISTTQRRASSFPLADLYGDLTGVPIQSQKLQVRFPNVPPLKSIRFRIQAVPCHIDFTPYRHTTRVRREDSTRHTRRYSDLVNDSAGGRWHRSRRDAMRDGALCRWRVRNAGQMDASWRMG